MNTIRHEHKLFKKLMKSKPFVFLVIGAFVIMLSSCVFAYWLLNFSSSASGLIISGGETLTFDGSGLVMSAVSSSAVESAVTDVIYVENLNSVPVTYQVFHNISVTDVLDDGCELRDHPHGDAEIYIRNGLNNGVLLDGDEIIFDPGIVTPILVQKFVKPLACPSEVVIDLAIEPLA